MMRRQLLRVKQIADQTFQRGEKTEVLTDELTTAEKRVELIKQSCQNSGKKLATCVQRLATDGASTDRRSTKKVPEAQLAQCMEEWGLNLGEGSLLGMTMVDTARIQDALACDLLSYKADVEETIVEPLQNILKVDIANVVKCRKQLAKLTADMDSCKLRYQTAVKNCQQVTGNGLTTAIAKAEFLREESEDASTKVDQCRDMLAAEMFNLISREPELSQLFIKLCHLQLEYHRAALAVLECTLPELEAQIRSYPYHPVFGTALEDHLHFTNKEIAIVIESCVCWLLETAMNEEGLFRIGGSITKIRKMKSAFDAGVAHLVEDERDPHNIAGALKLYLRNLPEPLLTYDLYEDWMEAARITDHDTQLQALWTVVNSLPESNFKNLRYLVKFLSKLCQNAEVNKMSSQNLAIVMGPNLLWSPVEEVALGMNMTATNLHSSIVDALITYADWFFPGDCEFYVSTPTSPRHLNSFLGSLRGSQLSLSTTKLSNGDSAVDSLSSSPTNSPKSPSPRGVPRPRKKTAPVAPGYNDSSRHQITRSLSCGVFQPNSNGQPIRNKRFSYQSISHEDLLKASYETESQCAVKQKLTTIDNYKNGEYTKSNQPNKMDKFEAVYNDHAPVTRPARTKAKGNALPPLMERGQRVERPSVPPPERPTSTKQISPTLEHSIPKCITGPGVINNGCITGPGIINNGCIDINDISFSLCNTSSEQFSGIPISFMDDSDYEEEKSPQPKTLSIAEEHPMLSSTTEDNEIIGAGTPNWFDHYNGNRRLSNSVWFDFPSERQMSNDENSVFREKNQSWDNAKDLISVPEDFSFTSSPQEKIHRTNEQFCTIIPVGDCDTNLASTINVEYKSFHKFPAQQQDTKIKLRVNSETQNTRL